MADPPPNPHDALFRHVFSQPENAVAELRHVLPAEIGEAVEWDTLEVCSGTRIDAELRETQADLLCSVQLRGRPAFLYVLLEHKSWSDVWTPFQLLVYMVRSSSR